MRHVSNHEAIPVRDGARALLAAIEAEVGEGLARGSEARAAFECLIASLRDHIDGGAPDENPAELLDCLEDVLETHLFCDRETAND